MYCNSMRFVQDACICAMWDDKASITSFVMPNLNIGIIVDDIVHNG